MFRTDYQSVLRDIFDKLPDAEHVWIRPDVDPLYSESRIRVEVEVIRKGADSRPHREMYVYVVAVSNTSPFANFMETLTTRLFERFNSVWWGKDLYMRGTYEA